MVQVANDSGLSISHISHSHLCTPNHTMQLSNTCHVPYINKNRLYVQRFTSDNKVLFEFYPHFFLVKDQTIKVPLLRGKNKGGLYYTSTAAPNKVRQVNNFKLTLSD